MRKEKSSYEKKYRLIETVIYILTFNWAIYGSDNKTILSNI